MSGNFSGLTVSLVQSKDARNFTPSWMNLIDITALR